MRSRRNNRLCLSVALSYQLAYMRMRIKRARSRAPCRCRLCCPHHCPLPSASALLAPLEYARLEAWSRVRASAPPFTAAIKNATKATAPVLSAPAPARSAPHAVLQQTSIHINQNAPAPDARAPDAIRRHLLAQTLASAPACMARVPPPPASSTGQSALVYEV